MKSSPINDQRIYEILSAALTGTTAMSIFSYATSEKEGRNFREPELLNILINRMPIGVKIDRESLIGWTIHYIVGIIFCYGYSKWWSKTKQSTRIISGIPLGFAAGIVGAVIWRLTLAAHPFPPVIHYRKYYMHIILAHVFFGLFSGVGYNLPALLKNRNVQHTLT